MDRNQKRIWTGISRVSMVAERGTVLLQRGKKHREAEVRWKEKWELDGKSG